MTFFTFLTTVRQVRSLRLLLYTYFMLVMLLTNINTSAGLVNGATGTAVGIVLDPIGKFPRKSHLYIITGPAEFYTLNNHYIFCNKPLVYLLFKPDRPKLISLQSLDSNILPIFPLEAFLSLEDYSIRKTDSNLPGLLLDQL